MTGLATLPLAAPLAAAALTLLLHPRRRLQRTVSFAGLLTAVATSLVLLAQVAAHGTVVVQVGGWPAPFGITLVADRFAVLLLAVSMVTVLGVLAYAVGQIGPLAEARFFHPLYLVLSAGVAASFLTGDLFNLFVAFEVMLIASYVLLVIAGNPEAVRPAMTYVVVNLLASTLFVTAVGFVYAATGSVNMADLSGKIATLPAEVQAALSLLLLVVFGVKAAIFPLFFWLPDSYPTAPTAITAVFAGLLTKIGVYAIIRTQTLLFPHDGPHGLILFLAGATMLVGVLGAVAQDDIKRILSFHIVSQIGYMIMGLGLYTVAGLAGATLFIVHQIPVKTALFLVGGIVEHLTGTGALERIGGLAKRLPVVAILFMLAALSLAGLPPFSGFFGKLALVQAGFEAERYLVVGVSLVVSLLTLFSMTKIWAGAFWGLPQIEGGSADADDGRLHAPAGMTLASVAVVGVTVVIALGIAPLYELSVAAAQDLVDPTVYVDAVLGAGS